MKLGFTYPDKFYPPFFPRASFAVSFNLLLPRLSLLPVGLLLALSYFFFLTELILRVLLQVKDSFASHHLRNKMFLIAPLATT